MKRSKRKMSKKEEKQKRVLVIDPKTLREGTCRFQKSDTGENWAVCKEDGKIKLFPVEKEKKEK